MLHDSTAPSPRVIALQGCRIERVLDGAAEIVDAEPSDRAFPDRVNESLGLCLKAGPAHEVRADGRTLRYPADTLCIRTPGTVWSTRATGPVGFLSLDLEPELLPEGGLAGGMRFADPAALPDLRHAVARLRSRAGALEQQTTVAEVVNRLLAAGLIAARGLGDGVAARAVSRARELLEARLASPPSLQELADAVGANRFVLLRAFRRRYGVPPHAFVLRLRVERARTLLARGADLSQTSLQLGFADQSHFTRVFKRVVGLAPGAYRRASRNGVARSIAFKNRRAGGR